MGSAQWPDLWSTPNEHTGRIWLARTSLQQAKLSRSLANNAKPPGSPDLGYQRWGCQPSIFTVKWPSGVRFCNTWQDLFRKWWVIPSPCVWFILALWLQLFCATASACTAQDCVGDTSVMPMRQHAACNLNLLTEIRSVFLDPCRDCSCLNLSELGCKCLVRGQYAGGHSRTVEVIITPNLWPK